MTKAWLAALALALVSCATPYQDYNWFFGGVRAEPVSTDVYRVSGELNAMSSQNQMQDYMLMRAAETAQAQGAVGFVILDSRDQSVRGAYVVPGTATTTGSAYAVGNTVYGQSTTTYSPAQAYSFIRPGGAMMIQLVREPIPTGVQYFNAAEIIAAIGPRLGRR